MLVLYEYDSNVILAKPMKNRTAKSIVAAYQTIHQLLVKRGLKPSLQHLDNEASAALRTYLDDHHIDYQLVPPHVHRFGRSKIISSPSFAAPTRTFLSTYGISSSRKNC